MKGTWLREIRSFSPMARPLRRHFMQRFNNPKQASEERFVWDYWHVPDQYTLVRTPAHLFFPRSIYETFHRQLVEYGRRHLGCHDISPPWLSYYVEGCGQELHTDNPHGPFAYVFSLTDWARRTFSGGETMLLRPEVLDFWRTMDFSKGFEREDLSQRVPARFNQLLVFDPRIPHGVSEVRGVRDPRLARIVIHGWFVQPRPYLEGALTPQDVQAPLEDLLRRQESQLAGLGFGTLVWRLWIRPSGLVARVEVITNTLRGQQGVSQSQGLRSLRSLRRALLGLRLPRKSKASQLTLPLIFDPLGSQG